MNYNSSHICIFNKNGQVLLLKRAKNDEWMPNHWSIPGGRRKEGETLLQNIIRETLEETNLTIFPPFIRFLPEISEKLNHVFFTTSRFTGSVKLDHENSEYIWISPENIPERSSVPNLKAEVYAAKELNDSNIRIIVKSKGIYDI